MKNKIIFSCLLAAVAAGTGCQPESPTAFSQKASVYFGAPNVLGTQTNNAQYSFATHPNRTVDTLMIPVTLLGSPAGKDRAFTVTTADSTGANGTAGVDFQLLPPYILPANATNTTIPVVLFRSHTLDSTAVTFWLKIGASQDLVAPTNNQTTFMVQVGYLQKPPTWDAMPTGVQGWADYQPDFGSWTKTKYLAILDALYNPVVDSTIAVFPYDHFSAPAIATQYLQIVKNYIRTNYPGNYGGTGPKLLDPDANNLPVQVGPANY